MTYRRLALLALLCAAPAAGAEAVSAQGTAVAGPASVSAIRVQSLAALHRDGQTFLTWTSPAGTGLTYRVYASGQPIKGSSSLAAATLLGSVGDSSWCDRRLSVLTGTTYAFKIDSAAAPLASNRGLFVVTPPANGSVYYAVTVQAAGSPEDRSISLGGNSLSSPAVERLATPHPVCQRHLTIGLYGSTDVYTMWTSNQATSLFQAMSNRPSMPFDCAVTRGGSPPQNSLLLAMHARGGNFLQGIYPTGYPGQWVLSLDDPVATRDLNTFWYGYDDPYDVTLELNPVPTSGTVQDYTLRRVLHTLLWARRQFPIDTTRVYAVGASMGAIGDVLVSLRRPDLIAAVMGLVPKFDFSFIADPDPASGFNLGNVLRASADRLWGSVGFDLPSSEGFPVYSELNAGTVVQGMQAAWVPPLFAFCGKNDLVVGWAEKIPFFQAMRATRHGGTFFWDMRDHIGAIPGAWEPMEETEYLYRFRTDLSFPALSNCSADGDPGDGTAASGDSVGSINGCLEWDTTLVDQRGTWETTLRLRDLTTRWGPPPAPDSVTVDITPRRLQAFLVVADSAYIWQVTRLGDGAIVQQGIVRADGRNRLTVPGVKVDRTGSRLRIQAAGNYQDPSTGVGDGRLSIARPEIVLAPNPVRGAAMVRVRWPGAGEARVELFDAGGRLVRSLFRGAAAGTFAARLARERMPAGLYFVVASQGGARSVGRLIVLR